MKWVHNDKNLDTDIRNAVHFVACNKKMQRRKPSVGGIKKQREVQKYV